MNTLKNLLVVTILSLAIVSCKNETQPETKTVETNVALKTEKVLNSDADFVKTEFTIDGMTCEIGCARLIEKNINKMDGVKEVEVDFERKLAMVEYDESMVNHESLESTVTKTADTYIVSDMKNVEDFSSKEKHMENCDKDCCKDKTEAEKMACSVDCKKACCADKKSDTK
jgi:mercuric ion binding protein